MMIHRDMKLTEKEFSSQVLKRFNKSVYEWKEDVIRPKLCLERLVKPLIVVTSEDLQKGYEAKYGHRVQLVRGDSMNFKITRPEDLVMAERIYAEWGGESDS